MDVISLVAWALLGTIATVTLGFIVLHQRNQRYDGIDSLWGLLFTVAVATVLLQQAPSPSSISWLVALMVSAWGIRLSLHIGGRFLRSKQEDPRYVELRSHWPQSHIALQVYCKVFLVQAILSVMIALPALLLIQYGDNANLALAYIGGAVWLIGIGIEIIADAQLKRFVSQPEHKGLLMQSGLWSRSRHPNYFGEVLLWWGIGIMALGVPYGWIGLLGPLTITLLITRVSGLPPAEKRMAQKQGWDTYRQKTPILIPKLWS